MEITYNLSAISEVAEQILSSANHKTILFYGDLGAGKTTLIKSLVKQLGSNDTVSSPTFSILNEYLGVNEESILHFDLYRLKTEDEAYDLGIEEYLQRDCWKFIEWPERINIFDDYDVHSAKIISLNEEGRKLNFI
ncbi:tRNA (adenosine(37)-N6)-threonylcarbamoyltransferase complex ATPase subunit type 1 TsaE [Leeuwenhoekiella sp. NPDC079379]|uniref:tRNA (adenosine(37)-N6)-threonylcarbamoyltransferase complex ATPase subunit type 1 TsaE n=1 Tax=Leeuwenhoekiella sp. NPDC079379 TaxID=3364122 RepID=UPI0037C745D1